MRRIVDYQRIVNLEKKVAALEETVRTFCGVVKTLQDEVQRLSKTPPNVVYIPLPQPTPMPPVFSQPASSTITCSVGPARYGSL